LRESIKARGFQEHKTFEGTAFEEQLRKLFHNQVKQFTKIVCGYIKVNKFDEVLKGWG